jgi:hypothetical protein
LHDAFLIFLQGVEAGTSTMATSFLSYYHVEHKLGATSEGMARMIWTPLWALRGDCCVFACVIVSSAVGFVSINTPTSYDT